MIDEDLQEFRRLRDARRIPKGEDNETR